VIHNVLLLTTNGIKLFHRSYWAIEIDQPTVAEFVQSMRQLDRDAGHSLRVPIYLADEKFAYALIDRDLILVLVADPQDPDEPLQEKAELAAKQVKLKFAQQIFQFRQNKDSSVFQDLSNVIDSTVVSTLKVVLLGQGGVGKTTILHMLTGTGAQLDHIATMAVYVEQLESARLGPYEIAVWDFPGQEKMVPRWKDYLKGTDVVLLVTDSTLKNVMETRKMIPIIRKWVEGALIWAIANKQDLEECLLPDTVERLLGLRTIGLVAIDPRNKEKLFTTLMGAAAEAAYPAL
jgi:small GTP-binding protein